MEFHEKLQQLRRRNHLTQEQLAAQLFVSRTAVSKWESGRGYPNLESLKCISKLFSISIDELLSNDELLKLAETENRANINKVSGLFFGALDLITIAFVFMPLFGQQEGAYVRAVTLLGLTSISNVLRILGLISLAAISVFGIFEISIVLSDNQQGPHVYQICSVALYAAAILLFAVLRQPYITLFLFLLFIVKVVLIVQEKRIK